MFSDAERLTRCDIETATEKANKQIFWEEQGEHKQSIDIGHL
jgi:hypothetical protein